MIKETFLSRKNLLWFWVFLGLTVASYVFYVLVVPLGQHSGNSVAGYTLGTLTGLGVLYLLYFGIRKRSYFSSGTPLKDCLAIHVWFGISLIFIGAMHSGFTLGFNLHGLTYLAMLATILSGIWGAFVYITLADKIPSHRGQMAGESALQRIAVLDQEFSKVPGLNESEFGKLLKRLIPKLTLKEIRRFSYSAKELSEEFLKLAPSELQGREHLIKLVAERASLLTKLKEELHVKRAIKGWLYWHVPLSMVTLVLLVLHVISVFYWS